MFSEGARGERGEAYSFVACLSHWTTESFLLLIETTPPTFGRSVTFLHVLHEVFWLIVSPWGRGGGVLFIRTTWDVIALVFRLSIRQLRFSSFKRRCDDVKT